MIIFIRNTISYITYQSIKIDWRTAGIERLRDFIN